MVPSLRVVAADGDGIELKDVRVGVLSVNAVLAPYFWRDCAGIIGFDFISRFVDEIDFDRGQLTLYDPETFRYAGAGQAIPMTLAGHTPVVKMKLDDAIEGDFRVDVGSGSTVDLHTPFVKRHDLAKRRARRRGDGRRLRRHVHDPHGAHAQARDRALTRGPTRWSRSRRPPPARSPARTTPATSAPASSSASR